MRFSVVASSAAVLLAGCKSSTSSAAQATGPQPVEVQSTGVPGEAAAVHTVTVTATVEAVDTAARMITLRGEDGHVQTFNVPAEVKRLNEIAAGDTVVAEVQEGLLLEYQPAGSAFLTPRAVVAGAKTDRYLPPGAAVAASVQSTVTITAIDLKTRVVQFQDPDGNKYQVKAGPNLSIEKLTIGDRLLATYAASIALALEKKPQ